MPETGEIMPNYATTLTASNWPGKEYFEVQNMIKNFWFWVSIVLFVFLCLAVAYIICLRRSKRRSKPLNDQIENEEVSLVSAPGNKVEHQASNEQLLKESNDKEEQDFIVNELYDSLESLQVVNEVKQNDSKEFNTDQNRIQTKYLGERSLNQTLLNDELQMRFKNSDPKINPEEINQDSNMEVKDTSIEESSENISFTPQMIKVNAEVYDNHDDIVQGIKSAINSSNERLTQEINNSVLMREGGHTNFQETHPEINNRNDDGGENSVDKIDKTRSVIDGQNISGERFSGDDDTYMKQDKYSSEFRKRNLSSNSEGLKENRIYNKPKGITSARNVNNSVESNVTTTQCSNDEETLLLENRNDASSSEGKRVSNSFHRWVTQHSGIYHDNPSSNLDEEGFVDNCLYGNPGRIIRESCKKPEEEDGIDQHPSIKLDNTPSIPKECISYSDDEQFVDNILYADPEKIKLEIKKFHESERENRVVLHADKISSTHKKSYFDEDDDHQYEDPEEILEYFKNSNKSDKRDLISYPSFSPDEISFPQKECAFDDDGDHEYAELEQTKGAVRNSHYQPPSPTANEFTHDSHDEEFVNNILYDDPDEIVLERGRYSQGSEKKECVDSHQSIFPEEISSPTKKCPSPLDKEESVDNSLYDDPDEIMPERGTHSQESEKKEGVDSHPYNFAETVSSTTNECLDSDDKKEFVDEDPYDVANVIQEIGIKSLDSEKKECVDSHSNIHSENPPSTPKECTSNTHQDFVDNHHHDEKEIIQETEKHFLE